MQTQTDPHAAARSLVQTLLASDADLDAGRKIDWPARQQALDQLWESGYAYDYDTLVASGYVLITPEGDQLPM